MDSARLETNASGPSPSYLSPISNCDNIIQDKEVDDHSVAAKNYIDSLFVDFERELAQYQLGKEQK